MMLLYSGFLTVVVVVTVLLWGAYRIRKKVRQRFQAAFPGEAWPAPSHPPGIAITGGHSGGIEMAGARPGDDSWWLFLAGFCNLAVIAEHRHMPIRWISLQRRLASQLVPEELAQ
jgi:hypothetical protein